MIDAPVLRYKFWVADYPNLDPNSVGSPIPFGYGILTNITPVCIDTAIGKWKILRRKIKAIDAVRSAGAVLVENIDYVTDLTNGELTIHKTPLLQANTTYYFVIESDYTISAANYIGFAQMPTSPYTGGKLYYIDDSDIWSEQVGADIQFKIFVKDAIDGDPWVIVNNSVWHYGGNGWNWGAELRKTTASERIAQSFTTPATGGPWYLYEVWLCSTENGAISNPHNTYMKILSAYSPSEVQVGCQSYRMENYDYGGTVPVGEGYFPQRSEVDDLSVDIKGHVDGSDVLITNVADIIQDVYVNEIGGASGDLDTATLAALKAAKTEVLQVYQNQEGSFGSFVEKLESGQLFKMFPLTTQKYGFAYFQSGTPAGTLSFYDEDFIGEFVCSYKLTSVKETVQAFYGQDPTSGDRHSVEVRSNVADVLYRIKELLSIETCHSSSVNATALAQAHINFLEHPLKLIKFCVRKTAGGGNTFTLLPMDKIKIYRERGVIGPAGCFDGDLFRIMTIEKSVADSTVAITAILDSQTCIP